MKLCDICRRQVDRLEGGPVELQPIDVCGDCRHDLLQRFSKVEQQIVGIRQQMRTEAITEWRQQRAPPDGTLLTLKS